MECGAGVNVVVTGAAGFVGARLVDALLAARGARRVARLLLLDAVAPAPRADPRVSVRALDLSAPGAAAAALPPDTHVLYHLAAVVSGHAEEDFDLGFRVNLDATRALLEEARARNPGVRFVFASTVGVFGGELPASVHEGVVTAPQTSYGTAKAMCELLVREYARRGWADAVALRLPTVVVRAGAANRAVTSFASALVREPLAGRACAVPVPAEQALWVASPRAVVAALVHAGGARLGAARVLALPGLRVRVGDMVSALAAAAGPAVAARVHYEHDEHIARMVASFPSHFDTSLAESLGFVGDVDFTHIVLDYMRHDLGMNV